MNLSAYEEICSYPTYFWRSHLDDSPMDSRWFQKPGETFLTSLKSGTDPIYYRGSVISVCSSVRKTYVLLSLEHFDTEISIHVLPERDNRPDDRSFSTLLDILLDSRIAFYIQSFSEEGRNRYVFVATDLSIHLSCFGTNGTSFRLITE